MLQKNIQIVKDRIAERCLKAGRNKDDITLVAVSKLNPVSVILDAYNHGIKNFGENKAQELRDKAEEVNADLNWHFIGHLQTNKVKYVTRSAELIHSVDSIKLAKEIQKRSEQEEKIQRVLLEIKTSDEASKFGLTDHKDILQLLEYIKDLKNVDAVGLMTMAPYTGDEKIVRNCFSSLFELKEKLISDGFNLEHLSMGMTNDFEFAIEEGATILRIGTAIFGERNY